MKKEESDKLTDKTMEGLKIAYERTVEFKRQKGTDIVIWQDGKIVMIKPKPKKS